ncbi:hypothetical protein CMV_021686 [Castanea mollissima]|uniref:Uncharacterized protein n=1 Tax=Castanea mollissima TaxID=60419 RepID=A0A8J4QJD9_9ROSI|nr:hypothetical protein CMV_021686 [Castanea mollissima]
MQNHNQCFYSARVTQSLRFLIPHNVTEPFQINNERGNRFVTPNVAQINAPCPWEIKTIGHKFLLVLLLKPVGPLPWA